MNMCRCRPFATSSSCVPSIRSSKAPTVVFEDGSTLQNGDYILDWLDQQSDTPLLPREPASRLANQAHPGGGIAGR